MQTTAYEHAATLLAGPSGHAHFVGIGGVGMAGLALLLHKRGWRVTGCDAEDGPLLPWLRSEHIPCAIGHDPSHADALDPAHALVVRSPAVPTSSPELAVVIERGVPLFDRGVLLAALFDTQAHAFAVCGSHGKTTTSTFTATLLQALGVEVGWCIGGTSVALAAPSRAAVGPQSVLVAECDESDGTLALYHPEVTLVTNVDFDHMEHFDGVAAFEAVFTRVVRQTRRCVVYCLDDARGAAICTNAVHSFAVGLHPDAHLRATDVELHATHSTFDLTFEGQSLGRWRLGHPGLHNLRNALLALGALHAHGLDVRRTAPVLAEGLALPARRFEDISRPDQIRVISDYAHHPAEIAALVATAQLQPHARILAVFQPHRYTRTKALGEQFPTAFRGVDALAIAPVYAASEPPLCGGTSADLYAHFRTAAEQDASIPVPRLAPTLDAAWHWLRATAETGDVVLIVGAGDVVQLARRAASATPWRQTPPSLADLPGVNYTPFATCERLCSYGVGGVALGLARVESQEALRSVFAGCLRASVPWVVVGGGTNLLVPDTGYPGIVVQLRGDVFRACRVDPGDTTRLVVGAALPGAVLLDRLQALHLGGLELMDGIPGTVGGWIAMNAGAHGGAIGDRVEELEVMTADGNVRTLRTPELAFEYRRCDAVRGVAVLSATLRLHAATPEEIGARREGYCGRRMDLSGLRTAGSVFRNPPGDSAGRLLDLAGCKGLRIGGAEITTRHANVIATQRGANASDVLALTTLAAARVSTPLHLELRILGGEDQ